ncbi:MFS transporter [Deinococcus aluminii]|uniref:Major facilitator superfamily (MFS) profile domain-containing protein n=1 Tax=Deinococcus aluminii TaxID=1656885 RepID=A0ABP9XFD6_9DEIO
MNRAPAWQAAARFVVVLGVVSLFADMTHEGARSITGPFLGGLGATGLVVSVVAGFGEFAGYVVRLFSGALADRTRRYWGIIWAGYTVNMLAVPLLALAGSWPVAALLIVLERFGRGVRRPAADTLLSQASEGGIGHGLAFGLFEALDQTGALVGPLGIALLTARGTDLRASFAALALPAGLCLLALWRAWRAYPQGLLPEVTRREERSPAALPRRFTLYLGLSALIAAGYADYPLIALRFQQDQVLNTSGIALAYALAMGVSALAALGFGRLFDRVGSGALALAVLITAFAPPLVFLTQGRPLLLGVALWGLGMGTHESLMRALVAQLIPFSRRGFAYGLFNTVYGTGWFAGSALLGVLYDQSRLGLVLFSVVSQLAAVLPLWQLRRAPARDERPKTH